MRGRLMAVVGAAALAATWTVVAVPVAVAATGGITGTVTGPGGAPVAGIRVYAEVVPYSKVDGHMAETITDANGTYSLSSLMTGQFTVTFEPPAGSTLVPERYDGESDFTETGSPTLVAVTDGAVTPSIDAQLAQGYALSGRVTDDLGAPLAGVRVEAYEQSLLLVGHGHQSEAVTAPDGTYRLERLLPGSYRVDFSKLGWITELYDDVHTSPELTPVIITDGDVTGIDAALERGPDTPFRSLSPERLLDTRTGLGADRAGPNAGGAVLQLTVGGRGGVPVDASAAVLNVTVTEPVGSGFVTVFPCGEVMPTASSVNFVAGQTVANAVVAKLGASGAVCLFTNVATHLVVDVNGAFAG